MPRATRKPSRSVICGRTLSRRSRPFSFNTTSCVAENSNRCGMEPQKRQWNWSSRASRSADGRTGEPYHTGWSCPGFVDGLGGGGLSVCLHLLFVANGRAIPQGGVPPGGIVEAFDEAEAGHACLDLRGKAGSLEQFAFEGGEEALAQGVVPRSGVAGPRTGSGIPDRAHRGPHAGFLAALAES